MKEVLISLKSKPIAILVGPEGGFSTKEVHLLNSKSFVRKVSLGPQILRAETAVVAAVSIWQSICGNWARNK
jgi:16S rRNA (uracil1498-N3)-methyltransferase